MKELYIDFDGVILDTITTMYKKLMEAGIDVKSKEDEIRRTEFIGNLDWNKMLKETSQINDSINCIKKIIESNKFKVTILTHVTSLNEAVAKINYIRKSFKEITIIPVPKKISKAKMVRCQNAILIDDYSGNLREWEEQNGIGIRFSTKLNGKGFIVIDRLDKVLDLDI